MIHVWLTLGVGLLGGGMIAAIVWLVDRKARAKLAEQQYDEAMRRLKDTIEADARGRERIARGELLKDDGHRRD